MFAKLDRLSKWVLGTYAPQDYGTIVSEDDGTFVETSNWDIHPLDVVFRSEQILKILTRTTTYAASLTWQTQHPDATVNLENTQNNESFTHQRPDSPAENAATSEENRRSSFTQDPDNDERQPHAGGTIDLLAADGSEFSGPREFGALLAELIVKVKSLEELVLDQQRHAASSTHIVEGRTSQNVHFADTYSIHGEDNWMGLPPTPSPARRNGQAGLSGVNSALVGCDRRSSTRGSSWPNSSTPGNFSRSSMFHLRDIGQIVRKWQIRFSGAKSQSIDVFLARLEDCRVLTNLSEEEVLSSLSELFTDTAATWYCNDKDNWNTWQDFLTARRRYGTTKRYQQRLLTEANNRTQGADEALKDYITCLIAILRKISPPPSLEQQLDRLHRMVRKTDFDSVD